MKAVFSSRYCLFESCSNISLVALNRYQLIQLGEVYTAASISSQSLFRPPILLGVIAIAGISFYEIVLSIKNRYRRSDS